MQISSNTTGMEAGICLSVDKDGRDWCVVVVKGTFSVEEDGAARPAERQVPLVYADAHFGDPATTPVRHECDFSPVKPLAEIIVNGQAVSPTGEATEEMTVAVEFAGLRKELAVVGDRRWERRLLGLRASPPEPFVTMPLTFDRAFGGSDHTHPKPKHQGTDLRNPIGVGYHKNPDSAAAVDTPLPNLENPGDRIRSWTDAPDPAGLGTVGRAWTPRIGFAGTYDEAWVQDRFPFLPPDFDERYFQAAPADQQVGELTAAERVRCRNMTEGGVFEFRVPDVEVELTCRFVDRDHKPRAKLDTLVVEPTERRLIATWRARVPLGRKIHALREVLVGRPPPPPRPPRPKYDSLASFVGRDKRPGSHVPAARAGANGGR